MDEHPDSPKQDPFDDDVVHDEEAVREAAEKMHSSTGTGDGGDPDPEGGHDPEALEEAARRMHAASDG